MASFEIGDLVVLKSGSMRMVVEGVDEDGVATVWCNEGVIGRDRFAAALLNKWEHREDDRGRPGRDAGPKGRGDREGGYRGKGGDDRGGPRGRSDRDGDDRAPRGKTGWDGKPREKKYFRKDG